jgi:hypothetical protein
MKLNGHRLLYKSPIDGVLANEHVNNLKKKELATDEATALKELRQLEFVKLKMCKYSRHHYGFR